MPRQIEAERAAAAAPIQCPSHDSLLLVCCPSPRDNELSQVKGSYPHPATIERLEPLKPLINSYAKGLDECWAWQTSTAVILCTTSHEWTSHHPPGDKR